MMAEISEKLKNKEVVSKSKFWPDKKFFDPICFCSSPKDKSFDCFKSKFVWVEKGNMLFKTNVF